MPLLAALEQKQTTTNDILCKYIYKHGYMLTKPFVTVRMIFKKNRKDGESINKSINKQKRNMSVEEEKHVRLEMSEGYNVSFPSCQPGPGGGFGGFWWS